LAAVITLSARAQDAGKINFFEERKFLFEVKQIDEFFERFNDEKRSFIRQNIGKYYPNVRIDRLSLLNTLFDNSSAGVVATSRRQFVQTISQHQPPYLIDFYEPGWYAEVICSFVVGNRVVNGNVVLRIETDSSMGSRWVISRIRCDQIRKVPGATALSLKASFNPDRFLSPMSHATNFSGLSRAFDDRKNIGSYIGQEFLSDSTSMAFMQVYLSDKNMRFDFVKSVQYYFQQVPGWLFIVSSCNKENSINTGWLITELKRFDAATNRRSKVAPKQLNRL
jgi:hypothetical protein